MLGRGGGWLLHRGVVVAEGGTRTGVWGGLGGVEGFAGGGACGGGGGGRETLGGGGGGNGTQEGCGEG